jgi:hypothetical protein
MIVEGGYLHSMKLLLERANEGPEPAPRRKASLPDNVIFRSLKMLGAFLIGADAR